VERELDPGANQQILALEGFGSGYSAFERAARALVIVACLEEGTAQPTRGSGASIYPAVQNMLLAARSLGLGATLTTRHLLYEKEAEAALGLPPGVRSYAILPIGYPMGKFGPVGRGPLTEIVYQDRWGNPYKGV